MIASAGEQIDWAKYREDSRFWRLIFIADGAPEERRAEARQAAVAAYDRHEPACVFELRFHRAMHTGQPL